MTEPGVAETAPLPAGRIRTVGFAILLALAALLWWEPAWLTRIQAAGFDTFQARSPRVDANRSTLIVEIDEKSIGVLGQWPWPRTVFARLVRNIARAQPAAIGIDVLMTEADRLSPARARQAGIADPALVARIASLPSNDFVLASAITGAPSCSRSRAPAILPARRCARRRYRCAAPATNRPMSAASGLARYAGVLGNVDEIDRVAAGRGVISNVESGGVIRRMPLMFDINGTPAPAFVVEMLRVAERAPMARLFADPGFVYGIEIGERAVPTDRDGAADSFGIATRFAMSRRWTCTRQGRLSRFTDRFVPIGATSVGIADLQVTPLGGRGRRRSAGAGNT